MKLALYNQCRSGPSHRVRIALALKGIDYDYVAVDIRAGEQHSDEFLSVNPQGLVPALKVDGQILTQSGAIIEWLEERFPTPALLPADAWGRSVVRSMAAVIGGDIQPINNLRIQAHLRNRFAADDNGIRDWVHRWIREGFDALQILVERHGEGWCFGDVPTLADIYLVPQAGFAKRFAFDMSHYSTLCQVVDTASDHPAFAAARPEAQSDWS